MINGSSLHLSVALDTDEDHDPDPEKRMGRQLSSLGEKAEKKDGSDHIRHKLDLVREADSIKRAITDIYRTAKLLHNYSIMVSTFINSFTCLFVQPDRLIMVVSYCGIFNVELHRVR